MTICKKFNSDTNGNVSILMALGLTALLASIALAIDIGSTYSAKSKMQDALDAGTLSAALNFDKTDFDQFGQKAFEYNVGEDRLTDLKITFVKDKIGNDNVITGQVTGSLPLFFSGVFKKSELEISVKSIAKITGSSISTCIVALNRTASPGLIINSGVTIQAPNCEMQVHSSANNAMSVNAGINIDLSKTCVVSENITDNSNGAIGNLETGCEVSDDPFAGKYPQPDASSCDYQNGNYDRAPSGKITLNPGVYCGWHNFNNASIDVELNPGLYIVKGGGFNVNGGNWSGDGIAFYMYDTSIVNFNSSVNANFTAPTQGDYAGLFITESPGLSKREYTLNSQSNFDFDGAIYLPNKRLTLNSGAALKSRKGHIVADRITLNGAIGFDSAGAPGATVELAPYLAN